MQDDLLRPPHLAHEVSIPDAMRIVRSAAREAGVTVRRAINLRSRPSSCAIGAGIRLRAADAPQGRTGWCSAPGSRPGASATTSAPPRTRLRRAPRQRHREKSGSDTGSPGHARRPPPAKTPRPSGPCVPVPDSLADHDGRARLPGPGSRGRNGAARTVHERRVGVVRHRSQLRDRHPGSRHLVAETSPEHAGRSIGRRQAVNRRAGSNPRRSVGNSRAGLLGPAPSRDRRRPRPARRDRRAAPTAAHPAPAPGQ